MKIRKLRGIIMTLAACMTLSACLGSPLGAVSDGVEQAAQSGSGGGAAGSEAGDASSGQSVALADHPIVGVWRLSHYVTYEEVDGVTQEIIDEPQQEVYFYFHPSGHYTMSYDELLDFGSLGEDDFDEYWDWRVTGPTTGEFGYGDEITTLTLSDDGMLTLHAEFAEDVGRVIPDRVLERYS